MKSIKVSLIAALLFLLPFSAFSAAYIKFDGIDGESKDKEHKGWIDLSSVSLRTVDDRSWANLSSYPEDTAWGAHHGSSQATGKREPSSGLATGKRDAASGLPTGKRDAASGLPTGKRDAASGLPTGKRDAASGLPTGKRQHRPVRILKEIDKSTPLLARAMQTGESIGNVRVHMINPEGKEFRMLLVNATVSAIDTGAKTEELILDYEEIHRMDAEQVMRAKERANRTK